MKAEVRGLTAVSQSEELRTTELRSTESRDSVTIELRDTLKVVTTITIRENEQGDTVRMSVVTDRDRARDRSQLRDKSEKLIVRVDTVYVAVRDSVVELRNYGATESGNRPSAVARALKWVFWIIVSLTFFIVVIKFLK